MSEKPVIAQRTPCMVEVGPGTIYWCQCGRSKTQPFCDGAHTGTDFRRWQSISKKRNGSRSAAASGQNDLPTATGPTRGFSRPLKTLASGVFTLRAVADRPAISV